MKHNIFYLNDAILPGTSANKFARINMAKAFSKMADVESVYFYFFINNKKAGKEIAKNLENKKLRTRPIYLPFLSDINEYKSKLNNLIHLLYYPYVMIRFGIFFLATRFRASDLIFIRSEKIVLALYLVSFFKTIEFSFEVHNYEFGQNKAKDFLYKKCMQKATRVVTVSEFTKKNWIVNGIEAEKIIVLPSGFNADLYVEIKLSKAELQKELGLSVNKKIATYAGSLQKYRGVEEIIYAAKKLENVEFLIIGGEKADVEYYKNYAEKEYGLINNLHFKGFIDNALIPKYLVASDVLLAPYSKKCPIIDNISPVKLFEYMAANVPIVVSALPRMKDIVSEKEAVFFEADNAEDLSTKIKLVLENKINVAWIANNAKNRAEKFTWDNRVFQIVERIEKR